MRRDDARVGLEGQGQVDLIDALAALDARRAASSIVPSDGQTAWPAAPRVSSPRKPTTAVARARGGR